MQSAAAVPQLATVGAASATSTASYTRAAASLKPSSLPFVLPPSCGFLAALHRRSVATSLPALIAAVKEASLIEEGDVKAALPTRGLIQPDFDLEHQHTPWCKGATTLLEGCEGSSGTRSHKPSSPAEAEVQSADVEKLPRRPLLAGVAAASQVAVWNALLPSQVAPTATAAASAADGQSVAAAAAAASAPLEPLAATVSMDESSMSLSPLTLLPLCPSGRLAVRLDILPACQLGVSYYPDFTYNPRNGGGNGTASISSRPLQSNSSDASADTSGPVYDVEFDVSSLLVPALQFDTTSVLALPLPPGLKIDIVPQRLAGTIRSDTGQVDLTFVASFNFTAGQVYQAPPLLVSTVLTTEQSSGPIRQSTGQRLDASGYCKLVGVARVAPVNDAFLDRFLMLPTDVLAVLPARFCFECLPVNDVQVSTSSFDTYSP